MKKIISLLIVSSVIAPAMVFAESPTIDPANAGINSGSLATESTTTSQEILQVVKDYGLDQVAYMLAQKLGQKMATMSINKTTGGADSGKDANFIKDFGKTMTDIEAQQFDLFTTSLLVSNNPYARDISQAMIRARSAGGDSLPSFTLGQVLQNGADSKTVSGDISAAGNNGWDYYAQLAFPQNTPIGATMLAQENLAKQTAAKQESEKLKITSSGFLPQSKCGTKIADYKNNVNTLISSQNSQSGEMTQDQLNDNVQDQNNALGGLTEDTAGCIEEMINNPVATTQTITNEAGKFGMDMTKNVQGWGQIVAGVFVSLFNGFVDKGLSSLKADYGQVKQSNVGGPEQLYERGPDGNTQPISNFAKAPVNIVDMRGDFQSSIDATQRNIDVVTEMRAELIKVPVRLALLDMCLPGPELIGLEKRMNDYYSQQTGWIQKKSAMGDDEKRNTYQELILSMIERDFDIAKSETMQDLIDDSKNIPGAGAMRTAISRFNSRKTLWTASLESITKTSDAMSQLRKVNSDLKLSITYLKNLDPGMTWIGTLPELPFTTGEWNALPSNEKEALYTWAKAKSPAAAPTVPSDEDKKKYVISVVWDLWENPDGFVQGDSWTAEDAEKFLIEKNKIRAAFNAVGDSIPTEWEISKNQQLFESIRSENIQTDDLIHDCDKMRELIMGDSLAGIPSKLDTMGDVNAFRNDLIQNKNTYFKSDEIKNSLTLPSILTSNRTWEDDNCRPNSQVTYQAQYSSGRNFGDHSDGYSCYGQFGHLYAVAGSEGCDAGCDFDEWIDEASNIYQSHPRTNWPTELYWKAKILRFEPDTNPYGYGWKVVTIDNGRQLGDGGNSRGVFCRFSSVLAIYAARSGSVLDRDNKEMYCSSKWADVSISEAVALFITNQIQ